MAIIWEQNYWKNGDCWNQQLVPRVKHYPFSSESQEAKISVTLSPQPKALSITWFYGKLNGFYKCSFILKPCMDFCNLPEVL